MRVITVETTMGENYNYMGKRGNTQFGEEYCILLLGDISHHLRRYRVGLRSNYFIPTRVPCTTILKAGLPHRIEKVDNPVAEEMCCWIRFAGFCMPFVLELKN